LFTKLTLIITCGRGLGGLLGKKQVVDVGHDTTAGNGGWSKELWQLIIISYSQLDVTWHNPGLLVISSSISSQFQNLREKLAFELRYFQTLQKDERRKDAQIMYPVLWKQSSWKVELQ
jgi:hypothetical protein